MTVLNTLDQSATSSTFVSRTRRRPLRHIVIYHSNPSCRTLSRLGRCARERGDRQAAIEAADSAAAESAIEGRGLWFHLTLARTLDRLICMPATTAGLARGPAAQGAGVAPRASGSHFQRAVRHQHALCTAHRSPIARMLDGRTQGMVLSAAVKHPSNRRADARYTDRTQSMLQPQDVCVILRHRRQ